MKHKAIKNDPNDKQGLGHLHCDKCGKALYYSRDSSPVMGKGLWMTSILKNCQHHNLDFCETCAKKYFTLILEWLADCPEPIEEINK